MLVQDFHLPIIRGSIDYLKVLFSKKYLDFICKDKHRYRCSLAYN